jgi:acylphosphatase
MVMFRDFVTRRAHKFCITGEVWNETDGTVRVIAEGEEDALRLLLIELRRGSLLAHVEGVNETWGTPTDTFANFSIRYT